jgi:hypothetical protein
MAQAGLLKVHCWKSQCFQIETSTDLSQWQPLTILTNLSNTLEFNDRTTSQFPTRFYRALQR